MKDLFQKLFPFLAILVFLLFIGQLWKNSNPPYLAYQKQFKTLLMQKAAQKGKNPEFRFGVRQRWVEKLKKTDRCETCHLRMEDPRFQKVSQPFRSHPDVGGHDFEKFGCTICHGGQGLATPLKDAHGPVENWNQALYHPVFMENSCGLCHGEFIQDQAPVLAKGRSIFQDHGCRGCHLVRGKERTIVGPPLDRMTQRVKPDWLYRWILNPKAYLPKTKMPNPQFSPQQAADVAAVLFQGGKPPEVKLGQPTAEGKKTFLDSRCVSCHSLEGKGGLLGPELSKLSAKVVPDRLIRIIKNPHELWAASQMPIYGFSDQEILKIVDFLVGEYIDLELDESQAAAQARMVQEGNKLRGKELIEKQGCTGCHTKIEGVKDRGEIGLELTTIGAIHISRLDFGLIRVSPKDRTVPNWLYNKMKNSRLFKADLKMPDYAFSDPEAEAVTTYLLGLKGQEVPAAYFLPLGERPSSYAPQGKFGLVVDKYRCFTCHKILGRGGEMATDLTQEGSRVRKTWLEKFMKAPDTIRPILVERMPPFKIQPAEIETLYAFFDTTLVDDRVENLAGTIKENDLRNPALIWDGKTLYSQKYGCQACHQINHQGGLIGPDLTRVGERLRIEWILYYLRNPKAFVKHSVEPAYKLNDKEIEAVAAFLVSPKVKDR
jgi:mono/diheme cytochrome c family protein